MYIVYWIIVYTYSTVTVQLCIVYNFTIGAKDGVAKYEDEKTIVAR